MEKLIETVYWYCTDFCINMANLLGMSYMEFNTVLFLFLMPATVALLLLWNMVRYLGRLAPGKRRALSKDGRQRQPYKAKMD